MMKTSTWTEHQLILASRSPRRKQILKMIGLDFTIHKSNYHENPIDHKTPVRLAEIHALEKARDVARNYTDGLIIGADTIVVIDHEILGKPVDHNDAFEMLRKLSGRTHEVMTGVAVYNAGNSKNLSFVATTAVTFVELSNDMINHYLDNYHYSDKAGSYAIQDYSSLFVKKITGCFYNVVGFPVSEFYHRMNDQGNKIL